MSMQSAASAAQVAHVRPAFRRDFHIAIICALPLEYDAASLLIDEFWDKGGRQYGRTSGDSNTYRNGRIGMHNVVLMLLPNMGKVSVAGSAASLRASYVGVKLAFLVGVCGGVPGIREMLLGDVVISDDLVQYDFGRQYPGAFVPKDTVQVHPGLSSKDVRSLVSYFKTESGKRDLQDDAAENLDGLQSSAVAKRYQSSYKYPGPAEDRLFEATYRHRHREPSSCDFCCGEIEKFCEKAAGMSCDELGCDTNRLVPRRRLKLHQHGRPRQAHNPEVFIGRVASADMVMKSGEHRDRFAGQYGAIAFEMEAAGLWDELPCIVVKGVCDYADSHKSKSWQPFAAATAAAVMKAILNRYNFADSAHFISEFTSQNQSEFSTFDAETNELKSGQSSTFVSNLSTVSRVVHDDQWKPLQDALFHFRRALTSKECATLQTIQEVPSVDSVLIFTAELDSRNRARKGSSISSRFYSVLKSVRDFSAIIKISPCPTGLDVLLWASVKVTIEVIFGTTHFEPASKLFLDIGRLFQADYSPIDSASTPLPKSLIKLYARLVRCCIDILRLARRPWYECVFSTSQDLSQHEFKSHVEEIRQYTDAFQRELLIIRNPPQQSVGPDKSTTHRGPWLKGLFPKAGNSPGRSGSWKLYADEQRAREQRKQLLDTLSTHDYLTPLKQSRRRRHAGTAEWLFETKEFDEWATGIQSKVFWCSGKIGSGKTILVASVIDRLLTLKAEKSHETVSVAFFLVRFDDQESTKADVILRSILRQAIDMAGLDNRMKKMLEKWQNDESLSEIEDVVEMLGLVSEKVSNFYIVIDGLDECEKKDRDSLLRELSGISLSTTNVRLFLCGRESMSREVEIEFQPLIHLSMGCRPAKSDIPKYIESAVQERLQKEELVVGDQVLIDEIKETLKMGADGMFLWVAFQLDALCSQHCDDDIRQAIRDLPKDLTETFKRALRRIISRRNTDIASKCFQWVAAAKRPLSIDELREAISIEIGQEYSKPERLPNNMKNISSFCENLVHVDEEKRIVQFAHHTVKQFLIDEISDREFCAFHFKLEDVDHFIGEICVTYLGFNDFNTTLVRSPPPPQQVVLSDISRTVMGNDKKTYSLLRTFARFKFGAEKNPKSLDLVGALALPSPHVHDITIATNAHDHPFLDYAATYMIHHTKSFKKDESFTWNHWRRMVLDGNDLLQYPWGARHFGEDNSAAVKWCFENNHLGLVRAVGSLSRTKDQENILLRAVEASRLDFVEALLALGVDPNAVSGDGLPAIGIAASAGSLDAVDTLLLAGAHVNRSEPNIFPALHLAALSGHKDMVNRLINGGASVDFVFRGTSALHVAAERGHVEVVEDLLSAGADLMIEQYGASEIMNMAAKWGHLGLLNDGTLHFRIQEMDNQQICDAIYTAIINGHPDIAFRIIGIRTDPDSAYRAWEIPPLDNGRSLVDRIFWLAVSCGHLGVLDFAFLHDADVNASNRVQITALQKAVESGRPDMVDALLAAGARIDALEHGPQTILEVAVKYGSLTILEEALAAGASVNAVLDKDEGFTALHIAAKSAALKVHDRLSKEKKRSRRTVPDFLHDFDDRFSTEGAFVDIINRLVQVGADLNARANRGQTPLQIASKQWGSLLSGVSTGFNSNRLMTDESRLAIEAALTSRYKPPQITRSSVEHLPHPSLGV